jgi:hypothetical protein
MEFDNLEISFYEVVITQTTKTGFLKYNAVSAALFPYRYVLPRFGDTEYCNRTPFK